MNRRILLVTKTDFTETVDGGTMRVSAIVNALESAGFTVDWVSARGSSSKQGRDLQTATFLGQMRVAIQVVRSGSLSASKWYSARAVADICRLTRKYRYVASVIEYSQLLPYKAVLPGPTVLDLHNIESELLSNYARSADTAWRRLLATYEAWRMRKLESRLPSDLSVISVVSDHDRNVLLRLSEANRIDDRTIVASNGVSSEGFRANFAREDAVVFVAHLGWQPNVDAALWLVKEVWPIVKEELPGLKLQLVGRAPSDRVTALAADGVEIHGDVESVIGFVGRAKVATAPLQAAGGTRLKILEGLACGTPVVATTLGALGLERLASPGVLSIADDASSFAAHIVRLVRGGVDPNTTRSAVQPYLWPTALEPLVARVRDLTAHDEANGTS